MRQPLASAPFPINEGLGTRWLLCSQARGGGCTSESWIWFSTLWPRYILTISLKSYFQAKCTRRVQSFLVFSYDSANLCCKMYRNSSEKCRFTSFCWMHAPILRRLTSRPFLWEKRELRMNEHSAAASWVKLPRYALNTNRSICRSRNRSRDPAPSLTPRRCRTGTCFCR